MIVTESRLRRIIREEMMDWDLDDVVEVTARDMERWIATGQGDLNRLRVERGQVVFAGKTAYRGVRFVGIDDKLAARIVREKIHVTGSTAGRDVMADALKLSKYAIVEPAAYVQRLWAERVVSANRWVDHEDFTRRKSLQMRQAIRAWADHGSGATADDFVEFKSRRAWG